MAYHFQKFKEAFTPEQLFFDEPMKNHTSFKIGGNVDLLICPKASDEIQLIYHLCGELQIPVYIMGNGSNLLVKDGGFKGVIIKLGSCFDRIVFLEDGIIYAEAGILLSALANVALSKNLKGLEFASGIPGTLGGAVYMNAGAYDGEMKDVVLDVDLISKNGETVTLSNDEMEFGYRASKAQKEDLVVLGSRLQLSEGNYEEIKLKMQDLNRRRKEKQPLEMPSAGSTFKRPEGHFAGKLIMDSNLRGYTIGGAQVSEKHCGFVVNRNNASAQDVIDLIHHIKDTVKNNFGVDLEPEVRIIGER